MAAWTQTVVAIAALAGLAGAGASIHARVVLAESDQRLALLERHDTENVAYRRAVLAKLDALCRAMPEAKCPLGENER